MGFFGVGNEKNYNPLFILCVWLEISLEGPMIIKKYKRKLKILAFDLGKLCQKAYKKDKFELGFMPKVFSDFINYKDES